jgi:hypothetical protein
MSLVLQSSGGGSVTVQEPVTASNFTQTLQASTGTVALTSQLGATNRIINGAMVIDQRNGGASTTPTDAYTLDRWEVREDTDGAITAQQVADAPSGFVYSAKITTTTADASLSATQRLLFRQPIEGNNIADLAFGSASAATVTLSFWVKSSLTGTFGGSFSNQSSVRSYPFTYVINAANTWEQKSVTIAGDTSGTWQTGNGVGLNVYFGLGVGSDYSGTAGAWVTATRFSTTGAVSVIGTLNATWQVTGVQLEPGSTATPFQFTNYQTSLANCQRYYYKSPQESNGEMFSVYMSNLGIMGTTCFPVTMRSQPTVTYGYSTPYSGNTFADIANGGAVTLTLTQNQVSRARVCNIYDNTKTGYTLGTCYSTYLTASAEL